MDFNVTNLIKFIFLSCAVCFLRKYLVAGEACLPSSLVVLGCSCFWNMNGLLERSSKVNGALLDHLPDVLDPVLLVLNA